VTKKTAQIIAAKIFENILRTDGIPARPPNKTVSAFILSHREAPAASRAKKNFRAVVII
jgi:hypothetical protein